MGTRQREKEREGMKGERERVVAHARLLAASTLHHHGGRADRGRVRSAAVGGGCAGTVSLAPCPSSHRVCVAVACSAGCATCDSSEACLSCAPGYYLSGQTCGTCCLYGVA